MNYEALIASTNIILAKDLPNTKSGVKVPLNECMKLTEPLLTAKCSVQRKLVTDRDRLRHPKDKELTDLDRRILLESAVADLNHEFELLNGLHELVLLRINVLSTVSTQL